MFMGGGHLELTIPLWNQILYQFKNVSFSKINLLLNSLTYPNSGIRDMVGIMSLVRQAVCVNGKQKDNEQIGYMSEVV